MKRFSVCLSYVVSIRREEQERGSSTTELGLDGSQSVLRLFDELVKCDGEGVLKDIRKAVEGVE